jgi:hypothetical protein
VIRQTLEALYDQCHPLILATLIYKMSSLPTTNWWERCCVELVLEQIQCIQNLGKTLLVKMVGNGHASQLIIVDRLQLSDRGVGVRRTKKPNQMLGCQK